MAKYTVTFSCGHTEVRELLGKTSTRENTIKYWEQSGICSECYKKQQSRKNEAIANELRELPELTGTEKQVSWALKIRAEKYQMFKGEKFDAIKNETSAAWWIENRFDVESIICDRINESRRQERINKIKSMSKSEIFKRAHVLARKMKELYPDTDYKANFSVALKELYAALKSIRVA